MPRYVVHPRADYLAVSPDDRSVAFCVNTQEEHTVVGTLWTLRLPSGEVVSNSTMQGAVYCPAWSYDSRTLAFCLTQADEHGHTHDEIWETSGSNLAQHRLVKRGEKSRFRNIVWCRDGSAILAVVRYRSAWKWAIASIAVDRGTMSVLHKSAPPALLELWQPRVDDSEADAYVLEHSDSLKARDARLLTVNAVVGIVASRTISFPFAHMSPDWKQLAVLPDVDSPKTLAIVPSDRGKSQVLSIDVPEDVKAVRWSRGGRFLAGACGKRLWLVDISGRRCSVVEPGAIAWPHGPTWLHKRESLIVSAQDELWHVDATTRRGRLLFRFPPDFPRLTAPPDDISIPAIPGSGIH